MSVQSTTQTMGSPSRDSFFPTSVAEALLHSEDQMHAKMEKTRSAFEKMSKKAMEAQAAKDKEISELQKALALAEARAESAETTAALQMEASRERENGLMARLKKTESERDSREQRLDYLRKLYLKETIGFRTPHGRTIEREWLPILCCFEKAIGGSRGVLFDRPFTTPPCKHDY
jgi:hypothetical protein